MCILLVYQTTGPRFNIKMPSYQYRESHLEIRRSYDRLISTMGFPILVKWHLYIGSGSWFQHRMRAIFDMYNPGMVPHHQYHLLYHQHHITTKTAAKWCMSLWRWLLGRLSCCPIFLSSQYNSIENSAPTNLMTDHIMNHPQIWWPPT